LIRPRRHTERLNRALHELRRPLQALVLLEEGSVVPPASAGGGTRRGLLELALNALEELDGVVNRRAGRRPLRRVSCRELVLASLERWRPIAGGRTLRLYWDAGPAYVEGDPGEVARALDNLITNALEHGGPPLVVTGARISDRLRITVANGDRTGSGNGTPPGADPRRGHGLPIVSEVAAAHGGRFAVYRSREGCVAALELPLVDLAAARAA
jgi:signal transduction histidine kinase